MVGNRSIDVFTGGGDDKIYLGPVGSFSTGHGGSGNDLVDLSGFLASSASAFGDEGDDTLVGSAQADTLDGGLGVDAMSGGAGDDIYIVDNAGDTITEAAAGKRHRTDRASAYALAAGVEKLNSHQRRAARFHPYAGDNLVTGKKAPISFACNRAEPKPLSA